MNTCILAIIYTVKMYAIGQWVEKIKSKYSGRIGAWWRLLHDRQKTYWWVSNAYKNPWYITRTVLLFFSSPSSSLMVVKTKNFWSLLCFDNKTDTPLGDDHVSPVWTFIDFPLYQVVCLIASLPWQFFWFCFRFWCSRIS